MDTKSNNIIVNFVDSVNVLWITNINNLSKRDVDLKKEKK